jgi:dihydroorotate dehydrogenase (fumarate)
MLPPSADRREATGRESPAESEETRDHMADLSTTYMGLALRNPLIVASCSLTKSVDGVRRCADAGAGAVVLKSLFEEQILADVHGTEIDTSVPWHPEALDYVQRMGLELGPQSYLKLIKEAKQAVSVPVIASLHCVSAGLWTDYVRRIADAGADGIELNISVMLSDPRRDSGAVERIYTDTVENVARLTKIPIAVKIGPYFTSVARMVSDLWLRGAKALVLFNRFYQFDIDIDTMRLAPGHRLSSPQEIALPLRWISLLSGRVKCDFAASTGVHNAAGVAKLILVGATTVQICSILYTNGLAQIGTILADLERLMEKHGFKSIDQMRGKLSQAESDRPELYERLQYIKALVGIE